MSNTKLITKQLNDKRLIILIFSIMIVISTVLISILYNKTHFIKAYNDIDEDSYHFVYALYTTFIVNTIIIIAFTVYITYRFSSYIHKPKKIDFYHSIPMKREHLYLNTVLMITLSILILVLLSLICFAGIYLLNDKYLYLFNYTGLMEVIVVKHIYLFLFILMYVTLYLIFNVTSTNSFFALIFTIVFLVLPTLLQSYEDFFSMYNTLSDKLKITWAHDFNELVMNLDFYNDGIYFYEVPENYMFHFQKMIFVIALLVVIGIVLYKLRKSEESSSIVSLKSVMTFNYIITTIFVTLIVQLFLLEVFVDYTNIVTFGVIIPILICIAGLYISRSNTSKNYILGVVILPVLSVIIYAMLLQN